MASWLDQALPGHRLTPKPPSDWTVWASAYANNIRWLANNQQKKTGYWPAPDHTDDLDATVVAVNAMESSGARYNQGAALSYMIGRLAEPDLPLWLRAKTIRCLYQTVGNSSSNTEMKKKTSNLEACVTSEN